MVRRLPDDAIWQVIAIGRRNMDLTAIGIALGGNARAGLEDTLYIGKGELSNGNNPLIERAAKLVTDLDRTLATATDVQHQLLLAAA